MFASRLIFTLALFFSLVQTTIAAPNIVSQNLTGAGTFTPGSTITFSAETRNAGPDAMNTSNSHRLKNTDTDSQPAITYGYARKNDYIYTAPYGEDQLHIYSLSNPGNPTLVNTITMPEYSAAYPRTMVITEYQISGNHLFIGGNYLAPLEAYGVAVYDISNQSNPIFVTSFTTRDYVGATADNNWNCEVNRPDASKIVGNRLYISGGASNSTGVTENFCIYDISNPSAPTFLGDLQTRGFAPEFDVQGDYAYLINSGTAYLGVTVINISNPANPTIVREFPMSNISSTGGVDSIVVSGSYLYVGGGYAVGDSEIQIVNISDPSNPQVVGGVDFSAINSGWGSARALKLNYPYLYASNVQGFVGHNVVDVSNPANPVLKGHENGRGQYESIVDNDYVYGTGADGLVTFRPFVRARFCIDNPTCATGGSSLKTVDINPLAANASVATSTTWVATAGTHTITYCSDIFDQYNFDGVTESNEGDNCTSYTFLVGNPVPPTVTFEAQVNGGAWSAADVSVDPGDSVNLRWGSTDATTCTGVGTDFSTGNAISGTDGVTIAAPNTSGTFTLTCTGTGGSVSDNIVIATRQLPNFSQPNISYTLSSAFSTTTGAYNSIQFNFQTTNDGGSATKADASYQLEFDSGSNGYEVSRTGSLGLLTVGSASNRSETINGPIPYGNTRVRVRVDSGNAVSEVNESDNERVLDFVIPPPNPQISINADKIQLRNGETTVVRWSTTNSYPTLTCGVSGPGMNIDPSSYTGNQTTQPINAKSEYTFRCTESITGTTWTDSVIVETQGTIEEI